MSESPAIAALRTDAASIDAMVDGLPEEGWATPTPAVGWTVAHQVGHLAFVFSLAGMAAGQPDRFRELAAGVAGFGAFDAAVNAALEPYVALDPPALIARWRAERDAGVAALAAVPDDQVVPWFVNPLPPAVLASAGMMELFAHGQDIADALGVRRVHTDRVRYLTTFVAHTRDFGYVANGLTPPAVPFRFEVTGPSGATWTHGPEDAEDRVVGDAVDLCLLAARRRHPDDCAVTASGPNAAAWLPVAQAYRGPAGTGREPSRQAA